MYFCYICVALLAVTGISIEHAVFLGEKSIGTDKNTRSAETELWWFCFFF